MTDRAKAAIERWGDCMEVREVADFILADAKRPILPARRRHDAEIDDD